MSAGAVEETTVESRGFGRLSVRFEELGDGATRTAFTAETPALAERVAAKRKVDLLGYGDLKEVAPNVLRLDGTGCWTLSVDGKVFTETFSQTTHPAPSAQHQAPSTPYPAWMDCFDRRGFGFWITGGSTGDRIPADYEWLRKMDLPMCASRSDEAICFAPGEVDYTTVDRYEYVSRKYGIPWRMLTFPADYSWMWNLRPLPYVQPMNEHYTSCLGILFPNISVSGSGSCGFPGMPVELYKADFRKQLAKHLADTDLMGWHGCEELPRTPINWIAGASKTPAIMEMYRDWKGKTVPDDTIPDMLEFVGWNECPHLDLMEGPWELASSTNGASWTPGRCDDVAIYIHRYHRDSKTGRIGDDFFARRRFTVPAGTPKEDVRYLHCGTTGDGEIEGVVQIPEVWVNGVKCACVPASRTGMWSNCYDVGPAIREGENEILVNVWGRPIQGYCFLNRIEMRNFPFFPTERMNRRWFDAVNFGSHLCIRYIENRARAIRSVDPNRPIKIMAVKNAQDLAVGLCRRYGLYQHDTGGSGEFWCPFSGAFLARAHGLPFSCEQGGPPGSAERFRHNLALYLNYGNDAVDAVFAVAEYTELVPGLKEWCENHRELLRTFGKLHLPDQRIAVLRSSLSGRLDFLEQYSWDIARGPLQASGRSFVYLEECDLLDTALCARYPVIWDCATELMTADAVRAIRAYVEAGGTFVAMHHTARHLPERGDAWPLAAEFGLKVKDRRDAVGTISFPKDETLIPELAGRTIDGGGVAVDYLNVAHAGAIGFTGPASAVATWTDDGTTAIADVRAGRGRIVFLGSPFMTRTRDVDGMWMSQGAYDGSFDAFLTRLGAPHESVPSSRHVRAMRWESKNGVYDVYTLTRLESQGKGVAPTESCGAFFSRADEIRELTQLDVPGHPKVRVDWTKGGFRIPAADYVPMEAHVFAAPRADVGRAALRWIRNWCEIWNPLEPVPADEVPPVEKDPNLLVLRDGWENGQSPACFQTMGLPEGTNWTFRTTVKVPAAWKDRRVQLCASGPTAFSGFGPRGSVTVNGVGLKGLSPFFQGVWGQGPFTRDVTDAAATGEIRLEVMADGRTGRERYCRPAGVALTFSLRALPANEGAMPLEGPWLACLDLDRKEPIRPGETKPCVYCETTFRVPEEARGKRLFLSVEDGYELNGFILNNRMINYFGPELEVTGLVDLDGDNLLRRSPISGGLCIRRQSLTSLAATDVLPHLSLVWRKAD